MDDLLARITAALGALAVGDALGRATEFYRPDEIVDVYEDLIVDFIEPVRLFDDEVWAEGETGPPTALVLAVASDQNAPIGPEAGGVAMLPYGIALGLTGVLSATGALPGQPGPIMAIAGGLSAALAGGQATPMLSAAAESAREAGDSGLAGAILRAGGIAQASGGRHAGDELSGVFPPSGEAADVVPFVIGIVYAAQNARRAILEAVNQGGHAPETAAIAGALCAALAPASLPRAWVATVERINDLDLSATAARLIAARARQAT